MLIHEPYHNGILCIFYTRNLGWFPCSPHINSWWRKWRCDLCKYLTQFGKLRKHLLRWKCKSLVYFTSGVFYCKSNLQFVIDATISRINVWCAVLLSTASNNYKFGYISWYLYHINIWSLMKVRRRWHYVECGHWLQSTPIENACLARDWCLVN